MKRVYLLLCLLISISLHAQAPSSQPAIIVKAARVLDVKAGKYLEGQAVLVRAGSIEAIGPLADLKTQAPEATVIDLGAATLLPGLIDCHTHLLENYDPKLEEDANMALTVSGMSPASRALLGVKMGREDVEAGITTVRDVGNSGVNGDVALRDAIRAGWVEGPRMAVSTRALSAAGGQFGSLQPEAQSLVAQEYVVVANPEAARAAVQQAFYDGANLIKVIVNTGPRVVAPDTMKAIVEEAHRVHGKVAAHAIGDDATRIAAEAGVDSIEHGYLSIPDDVLKTMAAKHIYLVPTDSPVEVYILLSKQDSSATPEETKRQKERFETSVHKEQERLRRAMAAGVPIAFGSDEYYNLPGLTRGQASLKTLEAYAQSGMTPLQIIQAATVNGADLIGAPHLGSIEKGKAADLIAVTGDPLKNASVLQNVQFVMLRGKVVKNLPAH